MHWKVRLDGDDNMLAQLAGANNTPVAKLSRDGVEWFLESSDFEMMTNHLEVKERAAQIVGAMQAATAVGIGPIYRIHYDNSKTVFRE